MRKLALMTMLTVSVFALAACGKKDDNGETTTPEIITTETPAATEAESTTPEETTPEETTKAEESGSEGALGILENIWAAHGEDEKFPVAGGDYSEENMTMDGPGKYGLEDTSMLGYTFGVPEADAALIDDAASMMHMMNGNTFTCGAFHITDEAQIESFGEHVRDGIQATQWLCGFPDKLLIVQIDDYVISMYGDSGIIENFKGHITSLYENMVVLQEEDIL